MSVRLILIMTFLWTTACRNGSNADVDDFLLGSSAPSAADRIVVSSEAGVGQVGVCFGPVQIKSVNAASVPTPVDRPVPINLSLNGEGVFFSDPDCAKSVASLRLDAGEIETRAYFRATSSGFNLLYFTPLDLTGASLPLSIRSGAPAAIRLSGPDSLSVGVCSAPYTASLTDVGGFLSNAADLVTLSLSGAGAGGLYSDAGCSVPASTLVIGANSSSRIFYLKDPIGERLLLKATAAGLASGTASLTVSAPAGPAKIQLSSGAFATAAGLCYGPMSLNVLDSNNNSAAVSADTVVTLTGNSAGSFYSDSGCAHPISIKTLPSGASSTAVYFKDNLTENLVLTAAAAGLTSSILPFSVNANLISKSVVTGPSSLAAGVCSSAITARTLDALNNAANAIQNLSLDLTGAGAGSFYSDPACTNPIGSLVVTAGSSSAAFYVKDSAAETLNLTTTASGLANGTLNLTITPGSPVKLALSGPVSGTAGLCSTVFTVQSQDANGNVVPVSGALNLTLSGTGGSFFSDPGCMNPITSLSLLSSTSSASFYFSDTTAENASLNVAAAGFISGTRNYQVGTNALSKLALSGSSGNGSYSCSPALQITARDFYGNNVTLSSNLTVNLAGAGSGGSFYSDSGCNTPISTLTLNAGAAAGAFHYKSSIAGPKVFTVSKSGLTGDSWGFYVTGQPPARLLLNGPTNLTSNRCSPSSYTVTVLDSFDNPTLASSNLNIALSGGGMGSFYSDSGCTSAVTSLTLGPGSGAAQFYFKNLSGQTLTLTASSAGLTSGTQSIQLTPSLNRNDLLIGGYMPAGLLDGPGLQARFGSPRHLTSDGTYLYISDSYSPGGLWGFSTQAIRRYNLATGAVTTLASPSGIGTPSGFNQPQGMVTLGGVLYIADRANHCIRQINTTTGIYGTYAGACGSWGTVDNTGLLAKFNNPTGLATDGTNLYVADLGNNCIRKIAPGAVVTTVTGTCGSGNSAIVDSGTPANVRFYSPYGIAYAAGSLFVSDSSNHSIRQVNAINGSTTTLAGSGAAGYLDATGTSAYFYYPSGVATNGTFVYVADNQYHMIRQIEISTGIVTTIVGGFNTWGALDATPGTLGRLHNPDGVYLDGSDLYIADQWSYAIRKYNLISKTLTTLAGPNANVVGRVLTQGYVEGIGTGAQVRDPWGLTEINGTIYFADCSNNYVRSLNLKNLTTARVAGASGGGYADGIGAAAKLSCPLGITTDGSNLYVSDYGNHCIRKIALATATVSTLSGTCTSAGQVDNANPTLAKFRNPRGLIVDGTNTYLYVADTGNHAVRQITLATGATTTFAGSAAGAGGFVDALGNSARFNQPYDLTTDGVNLYVADYINHAIRQIALSNANVATLAGSTTAVAGYTDATGVSARFWNPTSITTDGTNLYVADWSNYAIRKIVISSAIVSTLSGSGGRAYWGETDDGSLTSNFGVNMVMFTPSGLFSSKAGSLWLIH